MEDLKKWQRNQIFELIQASGLSPESFELNKDLKDVRLRHIPTSAFIELRGNASQHDIGWIAGDSSAETRTAHSWSKLIEYVERWLGEVKRDVEMPDLWAEMRQYTESLAAVANESSANTPFTPDEQDRIAQELRAFVVYSRETYAPETQKLRDLEASVEYLIEASHRVGRKDWLLLYIGATVTILVGAIPPEVTRHVLMKLLNTVLRNYPGFPQLDS